MNVEKLFETYPKARDIIKAWFLERMLESFKDETLDIDKINKPCTTTK